MQTSGRNLVKSYGLAEAVTAQILQLRNSLIFAAPDILSQTQIIATPQW